MSGTTKTTFSNPGVPSISQPLADPNSLAMVVNQLKQGVESLGGQRGGALDRACTLNDLVLLGLVTEVHVLNVLHK